MGARRVRGAAVLAALAGAIALAIGGSGCGTTFKLPTERTENRTTPSDGSYQMIATWTGLTGVTDALLIPGPQLYLAFRGDPGHVAEYATTQPVPLATDRFKGLFHPVALAASPTRVFVLDQGDTALARYTAGDTAVYALDCGPIRGVRRVIGDIGKYWYVREYDLKGRDTLSKFTDTTFAFVNGIAADNRGGVYVSGVIFYCFVSQFDPSGNTRTLQYEFRIRRYERGTGDRYVIGGWKRDPGFEVVDGTGYGATKDPRGLTWSAATGEAVFFADYANTGVQKFNVPPTGADSPFKIEVCASDTSALNQPLDVGVDEKGFVYVADTGNQRVVRVDSTLTDCTHRVDIEPNIFGQPLTNPVAVTAGFIDGQNFVYVVDAAVNQVVRYRKR